MHFAYPSTLVVSLAFTFNVLAQYGCDYYPEESSTFSAHSETISATSSAVMSHSMKESSSPSVASSAVMSYSMKKSSSPSATRSEGFTTSIKTSSSASVAPSAKSGSSGSSVSSDGYSYTADAEGYILPFNGTASTTQFQLGPELSGGTACGMDSLPSGTCGSTGGTGPGYLYAAINQLAFGANPLAGAGGPGAACGVCFELTPVSGSGTALTSQTTTFMIIDECPVTSPNSQNCGQCSASDKNSFGQAFHFDIASDAMNSQQYSNFYNEVTDGSNWKEVLFTQVSCTASANTRPSVKSWGCDSGSCKNNDAASVCAS